MNTLEQHSAWLRLNSLLIGAMLLLEGLAIALMPEDDSWLPALKALRLLEVLILIGWSLKGRALLKGSHWQWQASLILLALGFSFLGDVINSGFIDIEAYITPRHLASIPAFALAQLLYVLLFWRSASVHPAHSEANSISNFKLITLLLWLPLSYGMWALVFDASQPLLIERATLFYSSLVVLMLLCSSWIWRVWGDIGLAVSAGALLFVISDALIGTALNQGLTPSGFKAHLIWVTYFAAQALIARLALLGQQMEARIPEAPAAEAPNSN